MMTEEKAIMLAKRKWEDVQKVLDFTGENHEVKTEDQMFRFSKEHTLIYHTLNGRLRLKARIIRDMREFNKLPKSAIKSVKNTARPGSRRKNCGCKGGH